MKHTLILILTIGFVTSAKFKKTGKKGIPFFWDELSREQLEARGLEVQSELGKGGFGLVYKVKTKDKHLLAAKSIRSGLTDSIDHLPTREIEAMAKLRNVPLTLQLCDFFPILTGMAHESGLIITSELGKTDLENYLKQIFGLKPQKQSKPKFFSRILSKLSLCSSGNKGTRLNSAERQEKFESKKFEFISQMAVGLKNIHSKGLIHRDIKPENYLIMRDNSIVLADFGLSIWEHEAENEKKSSGTRGFIPNDYLGKDYVTSKKGDVYALGVSFELMQSKTFFKCFYKFECVDTAFYDKIKAIPGDEQYVDHLELIKEIRESSDLPSSGKDLELQNLVLNKMLVGSENRIDSTELVEELRKISPGAVRKAELISNSSVCGSGTGRRKKDQNLFEAFLRGEEVEIEPERRKFYSKIKDNTELK